MIGLKAALLKPVQKLCLIKRNMIPRCIHLSQNPQVSLKILRKLDQLIHMTVRQILHLSRSCSDAYIHAPMRKCGLGVLSYRLNIPRIVADRLRNLRSNCDTFTTVILNLPYVDKLCTKLAR